MHTCEITIQRRSADGWPVVVEIVAPGSLPIRAEGTLTLDLAELRSQVRPLDYGSLLGQRLFRDDLRDAFVLARARSEDRLRVLLFVEADDLRTVRWERLCAPLDGRWSHLARDQRVPFSLHLPSRSSRSFPSIGRPDLRALVLATSPTDLDRYGLAPFDVPSAVAGVRAALGEIPSDVLGSVDGAVGPPTLDALCTRLTAGQYTLLHVICHGAFDQAGGDSVVYLARSDSQTDPVSGARLVDRLAGLAGPRGLPHFAFLASCESASPAAEGALGGLAQRLVRDLGMPAVVAMTGPVSIETARALATHFYPRLRDHGEVDRALAEGAAGLAERYDVGVPALYSRLVAQPLFSDRPDRPLSAAEIAFGLDRLGGLVVERAPILRPTFDAHAAVVRGTLGVDFAALSTPARDEATRALEAIRTLCDEVASVSFDALALGQEPPPYDARCPFRGLYPFRPEDREFFFGREELIERLERRLADHPFLAVLGASGCGKSSLVLAGLIPILGAKEPALRVASLTPGSDPLARLEAALAPTEGPPTLLIVDQFEELFTQCRDDSRRRAFLSRLLELAPTPRVVITMRADFWAECAPYPALRNLMQAHQELIPPMDAGELRRAIDLQAKAVGLRFEPGLAASILEDVEGEPGAMPLLQHALRELWDRRHGRSLRADEYEQIGGVQEAIGRTADRVYEDLPPADRERAREIFLRLTRLDEDALQADRRRDTRRRVALEDLPTDPTDPDRTPELVTRLASARLLVTSEDRATGREEVEVAHEALIRHWDRLGDWLEKDRAFLLWRQRLQAASAEWERTGRDEGLLLRGIALEEARRWAAERPGGLNQIEAGFVQASVALHANERRNRTLLRATGAFVVLAVAWLLLGLHYRSVETAQERQAFLAAQGAARAIAEFSNDPHLSIALAVEAVDRARSAGSQEVSSQAEDALRRSLVESNLRAVLRGHSQAITSVGFSPGGGEVVTTSWDATARVWDASTGRPFAVLAGHTRDVMAAGFSGDGNWLITASKDRTARIWDARAWKTRNREGGAEQLSSVLVLEGHAHNVTAAALSYDGRRAITVSMDRTARIWTTGLPDGRPEHGGPSVLAGPAPEIIAAEFSPDGNWLVTVSRDGAADVWQLGRDGAVARLDHGQLDNDDDMQGAVFSPDSTCLATVSERRVRLWPARSWTGLQATAACPDPPQDQPSGTATLDGHSAAVVGVAFSTEGGKQVVTWSNDGTARVWETGTGRLLAVLSGHGNQVTSAAFSPHGRWVLTASRDRTARVWEWSTGQSVSILRGHLDEVIWAAFDPNGRRIATASADNTARIWDIGAWHSRAHLEGHPAAVSDAVFLDDNRVVTASRDGTARRWDVSTGSSQPLDRLPSASPDPIVQAGLSPDGSRLVVLHRSGMTRVSDAHTGSEAIRVGGPASKVTAASFSPDGSRLITVSSANENRWACMWQISAPGAANGAPPEQHPCRQVSDSLSLASSWATEHAEDATTVTFSADAARVVTGSADNTARVWDLRDPAAPRLLRTLDDHGNRVTSVAFDRAGNRVVTASRDQRARIWEVAGAAPPIVLGEHTVEVTDAAFSPDGTWVVTASTDRTARVWEASTGRSVIVLRGHDRAVTAAAFSPSGRLIVTTSADNSARVYRCEVCGLRDDLLGLARERLQQAPILELRSADQPSP